MLNIFIQKRDVDFPQYEEKNKKLGHSTIDQGRSKAFQIYISLELVDLYPWNFGLDT